jgi:phosphomannomutase
LLERLKSDAKELLGKRVVKNDRTDGLKMIFDDGSWVLMRLSGTEPLVRVYTEAASLAEANRLAAETQKWIFA